MLCSTALSVHMVSKVHYVQMADVEPTSNPVLKSHLRTYLLGVVRVVCEVWVFMLEFKFEKCLCSILSS